MERDLADDGISRMKNYFSVTHVAALAAIEDCRQECIAHVTEVLQKPVGTHVAAHANVGKCT